MTTGTPPRKRARIADPAARDEQLVFEIGILGIQDHLVDGIARDAQVLFHVGDRDGQCVGQDGLERDAAAAQPFRIDAFFDVVESQIERRRDHGRRRTCQR